MNGTQICIVSVAAIGGLVYVAAKAIDSGNGPAFFECVAKIAPNFLTR